MVSCILRVNLCIEFVIKCNVFVKMRVDVVTMCELWTRKGKDSGS